MVSSQSPKSLKGSHARAQEQKFEKSAAALLAAFESEDFAHGGCPDIGGPHSSGGAMSVIV